MFSADEDIDSKFPTNIVVYSDGTCSWVPLGIYISSCPIDITWFPFDDQNCTMKFGSWTYDGGKINLTALSDSIDITTYQLNGEWKLLGRRGRFLFRLKLENISVHGQVTIIFVVSVGLSVFLSVCLFVCAVFLSRL